MYSDVPTLIGAEVSSETFAESEVTVVVPDRTRPIDYQNHVLPLLERLDETADSITVLAGIGLHRPMTGAELSPLEEETQRLDIPLIQHDAHADEMVALEEDVSENRPGWPKLPAQFHPTIVEADAVVTVGVVEPHQYAGFSGGSKGVAIGCASHRTIGAMHGLEFLRSEGTRLGAIENNPFRNAIDRLVDDLPPIFGLQIVPGSGELGPRFAFDDVDTAFERAVEQARDRFFFTLDEPADWFHLPVKRAKATNFYQASRAATYVALALGSAIRPGGTLLLEAACPEGIGQGTGERACAEAMERGRQTLLEQLRGDEPVETRGGQQRAYVLAKALEHCEIALIGAPRLEVLEAVDIPQFDTIEEALVGLEIEGRGRTIEDVFHAVPVLAPPAA